MSGHKLNSGHARLVRYSRTILHSSRVALLRLTNKTKCTSSDQQ